MQSESMVGAVRGQEGALYVHIVCDHQIAAWPKQSTQFAAEL